MNEVESSHVLQRLLADFPIDFPLAMELGVLRAAAVPGISRIFLDSQVYLTDGVRRHSRALAVVIEFIERGCHDPRSRKLAELVSEVHSRHRVPQSALLYSLSLLATEPVRWIDQFGWRRTTPQEQQALGHFWTSIAASMNLPAHPDQIEGWQSYKNAYESQFRSNSPDNTVVAHIGEAIFLLRFSNWQRPLARLMFRSVIDDPLLDDLGLVRLHPAIKRMIFLGLHVRSAATARIPALRGLGRRLLAKTNAARQSQELWSEKWRDTKAHNRSGSPISERSERIVLPRT